MHDQLVLYRFDPIDQYDGRPTRGPRERAMTKWRMLAVRSRLARRGLDLRPTIIRPLPRPARSNILARLQALI